MNVLENVLVDVRRHGGSKVPKHVRVLEDLAVELQLLHAGDKELARDPRHAEAVDELLLEQWHLAEQARLELAAAMVVVVAVRKELEALELGDRVVGRGALGVVAVALVAAVAVGAALGARAELAHAVPAKVVVAVRARHVVAALVLLDVDLARRTRSRDRQDAHLVQGVVAAAVLLGPLDCHRTTGRSVVGCQASEAAFEQRVK